jgi:hypothetical protein
MHETRKLVVHRVRMDIGFYSFLLPKGTDLGLKVCLLGRRAVTLVQTVVSWAGEGALLPLANRHLLGTCGPPAVHPKT